MNLIKHLVLIFSLSLPISLFAQDWITTTSNSGAFEVQTPGALKEVVQTTTTPVGVLENHTFVYQDNDLEADNWLYTVSYVDYPFGSLHKDSTELVKAFLNTTVETSVSSVKGTLVYDNDIELGNAVGRIWRVDLEGSAVIKTKAFVKGNRFYTIQTVCSKDKSLNVSSDTFFKSFKWTRE